MKAKLIKTDKSYILEGDNLPNPIRLSFKNCEAIENGYDLDEMSKADADLRYNQPGEEDLWLTRVTGIEYGFNLALEILGDKKFSEEQVLNAFYAGWISKDKLYLEAQKSYKGYLKRHVTQQTEWQVEVVMDRIPADLAPGGWDVFPKLDAENCLILKRVE